MLISELKSLLVSVLYILHRFFWKNFVRARALLLPRPDDTKTTLERQREEHRDDALAISDCDKRKMEDGIRLSYFNRAGHAAHAKRCMSGAFLKLAFSLSSVHSFDGF
jgi:hypothetical protein